MTRRVHRSDGFTLMEVMIVVAIIGFLAAIAYPAYTKQIAKGRRAECRSGLMQAMQQQERYYTQFNAYAPFTAGSATVIRSFSGDSAARSACKDFSATRCDSTDDALAPKNCILMEGRLPVGSSQIATDPAGIATIAIDSNGAKKCRIGRYDANLVPATSDCWP